MSVAALILLCAAAARGGEIHVGDVVRAGDVSHWKLEQAGKELGASWSTYVGEETLAGVRAHHFEGGARLATPTALGTLEVERTGALWTDDLGRPLRFDLRISSGGNVTAVDATFADGVAKVTIDQAGTTQHLDVAVPAGAGLLANNFLGHLELIAALHPPQAGAPVALQVFSPDLAKVIPFELRHDGTFAGKWDDAAVEGEKYRDSLGETFKVMADGKLLALELPGGVVFRRVTDAPPQLALAANAPRVADFDREEVVIEHDAVRIAGTVTKRKGSTGRRPALFFVSGSGAQDRNGTAAGIDLGTHEILDRLTADGFLVLRVDDRGAGRTTGPIDDLSYDDLIDDARACIDWLLKRPDVDPARVAAIGHSEGGETVPILACERPLAAIVLMAAPGRSLLDILRDQNRKALVDAGLAPDVVEKEFAEAMAALARICGDEPIDPASLRADYLPTLKTRKWLQSHARRDCIAQIKQVKCPVLLLQGAKDLQVSAERDLPPLKAALAAAQNRDTQAVVFPELDHLFKKCLSDPPSLGDYLKARPIDREFLDTLSAWLVQRLKP